MSAAELILTLVEARRLEREGAHTAALQAGLIDRLRATDERTRPCTARPVVATDMPSSTAVQAAA
jgi:hypothetical protein